jgi:hypothetical protein
MEYGVVPGRTIDRISLSQLALAPISLINPAHETLITSRSPGPSAGLSAVQGNPS